MCIMSSQIPPMRDNAGSKISDLDGLVENIVGSMNDALHNVVFVSISEHIEQMLHHADVPVIYIKLASKAIISFVTNKYHPRDVLTHLTDAAKVIADKINTVEEFKNVMAEISELPILYPRVANDGYHDEDGNAHEFYKTHLSIPFKCLFYDKRSMFCYDYSERIMNLSGMTLCYTDSYERFKNELEYYEDTMYEDIIPKIIRYFMEYLIENNEPFNPEVTVERMLKEAPVLNSMQAEILPLAEQIFEQVLQCDTYIPFHPKCVKVGNERELSKHMKKRWPSAFYFDVQCYLMIDKIKHKQLKDELRKICSNNQVQSLGYMNEAQFNSFMRLLSEVDPKHYEQIKQNDDEGIVPRFEPELEDWDISRSSLEEWQHDIEKLLSDPILKSQYDAIISQEFANFLPDDTCDFPYVHKPTLVS